MIVVSLETSEMDDFVNFKLATEKEECGRIVSSPEQWQQWATAAKLESEKYFLAKSDNGEWLGAAHWSQLGTHEAKIFPLMRHFGLSDSEKAEVSIKLIGKVLHAILKNHNINQVGTRPFLSLLDDGYKTALTQTGFHLLGGRVEFKTPVSELPPETVSEIEWRPVLSEDELPAVAKIFKDAVEGYAHALDAVADPLGCIREALSETDLTNNLSGIHIGYVNSEPAAYIHVQINPKTGWSRITYMGVLKKFRGKGLGVHVHRHGFAMMRELGGTLYHGGTSSENSSMIRLFEKNGCKEYISMQEWNIDIRQLRDGAAQPELTTQRLRLEPMRVHHAAPCFDLFQDEKLYQYEQRGKPSDAAKFAERFLFLEARCAPDFSQYWWNWICIDVITNQIVGQVEVSLMRETGESFLAYHVFPAYWRKGFAKEACAKVIDFLFCEKRVTKVIIEMDVRNVASIALAESLGAKRISFHEKVQMIRGEWSDEYRYEILRR
jgi:ribosomal-protein-alanine N-acetyltransferase